MNLKLSKIKKNNFIAMNPGGISNRVKCLISMWRLSDIYNRKLILEWHKNHTCGSEFENLFENEIEKITWSNLNKITNRNFEYFGNDFFKIKNSSKKYLISGTARLLLTPQEFLDNPSLRLRGIDHKFSDIPEKIKGEIISYLKKLKPLKSIQREVTDFFKKYNLEKTIGVHIRRGDFADRPVSPGGVSSDKKFIERMNGLIEEDPQIKFFLCTDSKEMEDKMENEFPKKIIKFPKKSFERTDVRATQEGLIDLLLLSKTKQILGTYQSTFTEMAWWFGDCKPKMEIIIDKEKEKELFKNIKKEHKKIIPKIKRIILKLSGRKFL